MKKVLQLLFIITILTSFTSIFAQSVGDYRSKASFLGTRWSSTSNWETWNGSAWVGASSIPNSTTAVVEILSGHTMTLDTDPQVKDLTVNGAMVNSTTTLHGILISGNLSSNGTIGVGGDNIVLGLDGTGSGYTITGTGTIVLQYISKTTSSAGTYTSSANITLLTSTNIITSIGGTLNFNIDNGGSLTIPNATILTSSPTVSLNFSGTSNSTVIYSMAGDQDIYPTAYKTLILTGSGIKSLGSAGTVNTKMSLEGTAAFSGGANLTWGSGASLEYAGSSAQTFSNEEWISPPPGVIINNSNGVSLNNDITVSATVNLVQGNLTASPYTLTVNGSITGEQNGRYIIGTLKTGAKDLTASATAFSNLGLTFSNVFSSGSSVVLTRTTGPGVAITVGGVTGFDRAYGLSGSSMSFNGAVTCDWFASESTGRNLSKVEIWEYNSTSGVVWEKRGPNAAASGSYYTTSTTNTNVSGVSILKFTISDDANPLPVELTSFTALAKDIAIVLNWETATEVNNYGFEIERTNGEASSESQWETIGFVEGHGNSNSPNSYSFVDDSQVAGKVSYRLKQIDTDGAFEYSDVVTVASAKLAKFKLYQNHPNPFNPSTIVSFTLPDVSHVKLTIYNAIGQEVAKLLDKEMEAGFHNVTFDGSNLSTGLYIYRLETPNYSQVMKMMLVK